MNTLVQNFPQQSFKNLDKKIPIFWRFDNSFTIFVNRKMKLTPLR